MLDLVSLRCAWRVVGHPEGQSGRGGEFLQFDLPQPDARTIGAAAVGGDHQSLGRGVALAAHRVVPALDGVDREFGRVVVDANAYAASIGSDVVDAIGHDLAKVLVGEI